MKYNGDFEYAIGWNPYTLSIVGMWPGSGDGFYARKRSWLCIVWILLTVYIPQSASLFIYWGNMNAVIECLSINGPIFLAIVKLFTFQYRKQELRMMIDSISADWKTPRTEKERYAMLKTARISRKISIGSTILTSFLFVAYVIFKVWLGFEMKGRTGIDSRLSIGLLHPAYLPYDTKKIQYFLPTWLGQCISTVFCMTSYAAFDCFVSTMVLHVCGQLASISVSLRNLINKEITENPREFYHQLIEIVKRHERIITLVELIEKSFNSVLLPQMLICTLTFCFQGFAMFTNLLDPTSGRISPLELAFSVNFVFYTVLHLFLYCYVGEYLLTEGAQIVTAYYESHWYILKAREARSLLFIGHRSRRPLKLTAGTFFIMSRKLFIGVLRSSVGYLSMLLTVKQRIE